MYRDKKIKTIATTIILKILAIIFWLIVWHIVVSFANQNLIIKIPLPIETIKTFFYCLREFEFIKAVIASLLHIILGFAIATIVGTACGILMNSYRIFNILSSPILHLIRAVPVAAFIFIAWLWLPSLLLPSFISALMVIPIICSHVNTGLKSIDDRLIEMAYVFGMNKKNVIIHIRVPLLLPHLRQGCITGLGIAWKSGVAAEVICNPTGSIGSLLQNGKASIEYDRVFAVTLAIILLSLILEWLLKLVWKENKYE